MYHIPCKRERRCFPAGSPHLRSNSVDTDPPSGPTTGSAPKPGHEADLDQTPLVDTPLPGHTEPEPHHYRSTYTPSSELSLPKSDSPNTQPEVVSVNVFSGAHDLILNNAQIQNVINHFNSEEGALKYLLPYVCSGAAVDSQERDPPPLCHPGTRQAIQGRLLIWFNDPERRWNMIWITGPAGAGKSAIAQSFAELCIKKGRLGAAFFFSRPNERDRPNTVIPTLAYEIAMRFPDYKPLLMQRISSDPTILEKTRRIQLMELIIEPIATLQKQGHPITQNPLLILLDGVDECQGIQNQSELVEMIGEVVRSRKNLPLLWLICSRPEAHLKRIFERPDFAAHLNKEALCLHHSSQNDVEVFLRGSFVKLREEFSDTTDPDWPSRSQFDRVSKISSGLFVLASTMMNYLGDPEYGNPMARLDSLLGFMQGTHQISEANPLVALDLLYSMILAGIPGDVLPTTKRILGHFMVMHSRFGITSVQSLCNSLKIERNTFYAAMRRLHSVVSVPPTEGVDNNAIVFYHASFEDYLSNPARSEKFAIDLNKVRVEVGNFCPFTYEIDTAHIDPGCDSTQTAEEDIVRLLKTQVLSSQDSQQTILRARGTNAQQIIDILHKLLRSRVVDDVTRHSIFTAYLQLSVASRLLPRQLRLRGIERPSVLLRCCHERSAHEFKGEYDGRQVRLMVVRLHNALKKASMVEDFFHETAIWSQLVHPNILELFGIYHPPNFQDEIGFVYPLAENGILPEYLNAHPDIPKLPIINDILAGLRYLHQHQVVHGHLSGENILVKSDGSVCLTDFLPSSVVDPDIPGLKIRRGHTGYWTAPEVFKSLEELKPRCSFQSDIYSVASVMLEVFCNEHPWDVDCCSAIRGMVTQGIIPDRPPLEMAPELTDDIWRIMEECWSFTPSDRPTVDEVIGRFPRSTDSILQDRPPKEDSWRPEVTWTTAEMNTDKAFLMNFHWRLKFATDKGGDGSFK